MVFVEPEGKKGWRGGGCIIRVESGIITTLIEMAFLSVKRCGGGRGKYRTGRLVN